jgi:hypothetical protein
LSSSVDNLDVSSFSKEIDSPTTVFLTKLELAFVKSATASDADPLISSTNNALVELFVI